MRPEMKSPFLAVISIIGLVAVPSSALAQTKTIKACQDEWRANRVAMQAAGKTEKAYVDECRAGTTSAPLLFLHRLGLRHRPPPLPTERQGRLQLPQTH